MNRESVDLSALTNRLENELEADFPGWHISRESTGRWSATRPQWGALYGQSCTELRDRLARYTRGDGVR